MTCFYFTIGNLKKFIKLEVFNDVLKESKQIILWSIVSQKLCLKELILSIEIHLKNTITSSGAGPSLTKSPIKAMMSLAFPSSSTNYAPIESQSQKQPDTSPLGPSNPDISFSARLSRKLNVIKEKLKNKLNNEENFMLLDLKNIDSFNEKSKSTGNFFGNNVVNFHANSILSIEDFNFLIDSMQFSQYLGVTLKEIDASATISELKQKTHNSTLVILVSFSFKNFLSSLDKKAVNNSSNFSIGITSNDAIKQMEENYLCWRKDDNNNLLNSAQNNEKRTILKIPNEFFCTKHGFAMSHYCTKCRLIICPTECHPDPELDEMVCGKTHYGKIISLKSYSKLIQKSLKQKRRQLERLRLKILQKEQEKERFFEKGPLAASLNHQNPQSSSNLLTPSAPVAQNQNLSLSLSFGLKETTGFDYGVQQDITKFMHEIDDIQKILDEGLPNLISSSSNNENNIEKGLHEQHQTEKIVVENVKREASEYWKIKQIKTIGIKIKHYFRTLRKMEREEKKIHEGNEPKTEQPKSKNKQKPKKNTSKPSSKLVVPKLTVTSDNQFPNPNFTEINSSLREGVLSSSGIVRAEAAVEKNRAPKCATGLSGAPELPSCPDNLLSSQKKLTINSVILDETQIQTLNKFISQSIQGIDDDEENDENDNSENSNQNEDSDEDDEEQDDEDDEKSEKGSSSEDTVAKDGLGTDWKLVYRASRDGFKAKDFHIRCDNLNTASIVIIKSENSSIFGGFTTKNWGDGEGDWVRDNGGAFMFSLYNSTIPKREPQRFKCVHKQCAICLDSDFGPLFGNGYDLCLNQNLFCSVFSFLKLESNDLKKKKTAICSDSNVISESFTNFNFSYRAVGLEKQNNDQANMYLCGAHHFKTCEIEVFSIVAN